MELLDFTTLDSCWYISRLGEPFNLYWLEVEDLDPDALLAARQQTTTRFCHGESLFRRDQFRPFFQKHVTHGLSDHVPMVARCRPARGDTIPPR